MAIALASAGALSGFASDRVCRSLTPAARFFFGADPIPPVGVLPWGFVASALLLWLSSSPEAVRRVRACNRAVLFVASLAVLGACASVAVPPLSCSARVPLHIMVVSVSAAASAWLQESSFAAVRSLVPALNVVTTAAATVDLFFGTRMSPRLVPGTGRVEWCFVLVCMRACICFAVSQDRRRDVVQGAALVLFAPPRILNIFLCARCCFVHFPPCGVFFCPPLPPSPPLSSTNASPWCAAVRTWGA